MRLLEDRTSLVQEDHWKAFDRKWRRVTDFSAFSDLLDKRICDAVLGGVDCAVDSPVGVPDCVEEKANACRIWTSVGDRGSFNGVDDVKGVQSLQKLFQNRKHSEREKSKGAAIIEFALVLPVLTMIICVTIDISTVLRCDTIAQASAGSTARYWATHPDATNTQVLNYAKENFPTDGPSAEITVADKAISNDNFTMRVYNSGSWKTTAAKSVTKPKTVTVTLHPSFITPLGMYAFPDELKTITRSYTASAVSSEADSR